MHSVANLRSFERLHWIGRISEGEPTRALQRDGLLHRQSLPLHRSDERWRPEVRFIGQKLMWMFSSRGKSKDGALNYCRSGAFSCRSNHA